MTITTRKPRGFILMSPERRREIASIGGKAAQLTGKAHRFTPETAREAGRRGGSISRRTSKKKGQ